MSGHVSNATSARHCLVHLANIERPIRILHIVGGMNRGGVETWLMHVLHNIDRERYQMDFLVHTNQPAVYDDEILALGSKIIRCERPSGLYSYGQALSRLLGVHGPYDVIHSHVHHFSGYILWLAHRKGVKVRIAHSHTGTRVLQSHAGLKRRLYLTGMKLLIARYATTGLGVSEGAAASLFPKDWRQNPKFRLLYYGINLEAFADDVDSSIVRSDLRIPDGAFVLGHVGRFVEVKNHPFIVEVFQEVRNRLSNAHLLLVGDGPTRTDIERLVATKGLDPYVTFTGGRADIPRIMIGAMDVFVFPSLYEGFGLVALEAQAAGIPVVVATNVPSEVDVVPGMCTWLSPDDPIESWSDCIISVTKSRHAGIRADAHALMQGGPFDITEAIKSIESLYGEEDPLREHRMPPASK